MVVNTDDTSLVRRAQAGDREAYTELIRQSQDLVYGLAYSELGRFEDAQDAAQETFIRAWVKLGQLRDGAQFRPWLRTLARNECRMFRRRFPMREAELTEALAVKENEVEDLVTVEQALSGLSETNREAFVLFTFHSLSLQEVADFLGVPTSTVMSRLRNARAQLRKDMEQKATQTMDANRLPEDFATRIPVPYDEYDWQTSPPRTPEPLGEFRRGWLLEGFPTGTEVVSVEEQGHERTRVVLRVPDEGERAANIGFVNRKGGVELEAALLPVMRGAGYAVPDLLAGPTVDPGAPERGAMSALSDPLGEMSLLDWALTLEPTRLNVAAGKILEWMDRMRALTPAVLASPAESLIERATLADELRRTVEIGGPWMEQTAYRDAIQRLTPYVERVSTEPVFSAAGHVAFAVRVDASGSPVGMTGLPWARLEDPHYEITKAWVYDMWPFIHAGIVERYLVRHGLTMVDLAPRLAMRALVTIQRELPVSGGDERYRTWLFGWLQVALENLDELRPFEYPGLRELK